MSINDYPEYPLGGGRNAPPCRPTTAFPDCDVSGSDDVGCSRSTSDGPTPFAFDVVDVLTTLGLAESDPLQAVLGDPRDLPSGRLAELPPISRLESLILEGLSDLGPANAGPETPLVLFAPRVAVIDRLSQSVPLSRLGCDPRCLVTLDEQATVADAAVMLRPRLAA